MQITAARSLQVQHSQFSLPRHGLTASWLGYDQPANRPSRRQPVIG
jgi:hypothetical protein